MDSVDNVDEFEKRVLNQGFLRKKISTEISSVIERIFGGEVDNYFEIKLFATFTTSPAPIVINKSFLVQFSLTNFSISLNSFM